MERTLKLSDFEVLTTIASGSQGKVMKVRRISDDRVFALKKVTIKEKDEQKLKYFEQEKTVHAKVKHPFIVGYEGSFEEGDDKYVLLQFIEGETMSARLEKGRVNVETALKWTTQVAVALHYLHDINHLHRDVKPDNILIDSNDDAFLADLGAASSNLDAISPTGTPRYMAPEVINNFDNDVIIYNSKVDVYSLGIVFAEMLTGQKYKRTKKDVEEPIAA